MLTMRNNNLRQSKLERERWFNLFYTTDAPVLCYSSRITHFKRNIKTQQWFPSDKKLNNCGMQRYNQQLLSQKMDHPKRLQILSPDRNNRLFTTTTKSIRKIGRHRRKKKPLLPLSNKKLTTKDRLRLSSRPSASAMNNRHKENEIERMMIKSPEELVERMYSGLDVARTAIRESYASLRNPTVATSSGRNVGDKLDNHLLSARPASSGISKGTKPIDQKGIVMDTNWWFWNLLFAASPAVGIALYCKFIVEPEMKIRNEQRVKDAASEGKEKSNASFDDGIGNDKLRDNSVNKTSNMRKRQEQRKNQQQQQPDDGTTTINSPSSLPLKSSGQLDEMLSSYILPLATWFSEEKSIPTPSSEHGRSRENGTNEVEKRSTKMNPNADQEQQKNETTRLDMQKEELRELQSKLQTLKDKIDHQQQQRADLNASSDIISKNSAERESLLSSIGKLTKSSTVVGIKLGREQWASLLSWWQSSGYRQQPSDKSNCGGDGIGDSDIIPRNGRVIAHGKENIEKPHNAVQTAPAN
jgi:hypothetical protein